MLKTEIKSCPFCGFEASVASVILHKGTWRYYVLCKRCGANNQTNEQGYNLEEEAIQHWNRRERDVQEVGLLRDLKLKMIRIADELALINGVAKKDKEILHSVVGRIRYWWSRITYV